MARYKVTVPPTMEVGSWSTEVYTDNGDSKELMALQDYNLARDHDGLAPLKRMPRGTTYRRINF